MMDINTADVVAKIIELEKIDANTLDLCIAEMHVDTEYIPYCLLCMLNNYSNISDTTANLAKYARDLIEMVETSVGMKYDDGYKEIVADYFVIHRSTKRLQTELLENTIKKHSSAAVGSIEWAINESMKRELLSCYSTDIRYLDRMKKLIENCRTTDEVYKEIIDRI